MEEERRGKEEGKVVDDGIQAGSPIPETAVTLPAASNYSMEL